MGRGILCLAAANNPMERNRQLCFEKRDKTNFNEEREDATRMKFIEMKKLGLIDF